ncbi:MAG: 16S rRNA (cytosine(1402)-N(4))-methyltransferase RsmH [Actinomycetes bacterium]
MLPNVLPSPSPDAHVPVLAREVGALLDVHPGELIVDCTFGAGGHSRVLARALEGSGQLVAIDRDPTTQPYVDALRATVGTGVQVRPMHGPFATCLRRLIDEGAQAGAILMDLGMSSMQVDAPARGFSYMHDAPLDMRMDPSDDVTAASLVNEWSERDLAHIFHRYGEERFARQIAREIVRRRAKQPLETTGELVEAIRATAAARVVVLPNDPRTRSVADAAAKEAHLLGVKVSVVPTRSPVQALAALAVRDPGRRFEDDVISMAEAAGACRYGEVCHASREALTVAGRCQPGDVLALVEGEVHLIGAHLADTCQALLDRMLGGGGELVTLLLGADAPAGFADALRAHVAGRWPFVEVQAYEGGQPFYPLLVGVE